MSCDQTFRSNSRLNGASTDPRDASTCHRGRGVVVIVLIVKSGGIGSARSQHEAAMNEALQILGDLENALKEVKDPVTAGDRFSHLTSVQYQMAVAALAPDLAYGLSEPSGPIAGPVMSGSG